MSKVRNVCFTLNNPSDPPTQFLEGLEQLDCKYWVYGEEVGESGTPHFQGYLELPGQRTYASIKSKLGDTIHLEPRRGTAQQAATYCKKDGKFHEYGTISQQGARPGMANAIRTLREGGVRRVTEEAPEEYVRYHRGLERLHFMDLLAREREPVEVILYIGPSGCGKTRKCLADYPDLAKLNLASGWFDGYTGEDTVLFDDFDGAASKIPLASLLQYLDRYKILVPVKGAFVPNVAKTILVTTNYHPRQWYDFTTRRASYCSLLRRFARVYAWPSFAEEPIVIDDPVSHHVFFLGPRSTQVTVENVMTDEDEYYAYIKRQ